MTNQVLIITMNSSGNSILVDQKMSGKNVILYLLVSTVTNTPHV